MGATVNKITNAALPTHIGRFQPIDILGRGAQGIVYLAEDTQLGRKVAIKTLDKKRQDAEQLNQEAKNVSQLNHSNIIPLYEIGFHNDNPFLVYQYYEGEQLKQRLQKENKLKQFEAVNIINQVLDGIGYAHNNNIVHRDLNPSNLLIDKEGNIRVMDFGISVIAGTMTTNTDVTGTANYLAPEQLTNSELGPSVDIFACGLILYEMLTGHQVYSANNTMAVMYKISNETVAPPSKRNSDIDKDLDTIVMKALEKDPANRYANVIEMQTALKKYLKVDDDDDDTESSDSSTSSTIDFLLRRMKRKKDFPAVSAHITEINQKSSMSGVSSATELSNVILKDFALTTKVIRLVNSSFYGQFGGEITTVSRAVVILGYEHVRAAVLSIILFEHLQNNEQANELKNAAYTALMSGIIAREKAKQLQQISEDEVESAFVTSMFHLLGKLLSIYYFPEEFEAVKTLVSNRGVDEDQAMRSILGVTYEQLGRGIAKEWQLPDIIGASMKKLPEGVVPVAKNPEESLRHLACFSNELCAITNDSDDREQAYEELAARFNKSLGTSKDGIADLLDTSIKEAEEFTRILNIDTSNVTVFKNLRNNIDDNEEAEQSTTINNNATIENGVSIETVKVDKKTPEQNQHDILVNGIAEITDSLLSGSSLNEILTMVLETIYRGMGFNRVLFAIHNAKNKQVMARFGLGKEIDEIIPEFRYAITNTEDIFNSTIRKGTEYIVLDVDSDEYKDKIPAWLRKLTMPTTVVLYPLIVNKKCLGLIYADNDDSNINISMEALGFFKTLRNQASLAIQQAQK
ncbi:MAG: protein kinase [Proteobacteria bacterium]|nr:serine/threonine protein kinase [Pseudomonadota bacterium]NOG61195.1 protein kinase [Pseudomonadota bacterium]